MTSVPSHVTPLKLTQRASLDPAQGCPPAALVDPTWLGAPVASARAGTRRYLTDLSLPVRDRSPLLTFKKAAYVDIGEARAAADGCDVDISWQSSSLAPLFPVFAGRLRVTPTEITLEGFYAPPGGEFGAALDRAFLNIAARGTARWFLHRATAALSPAVAPELETRAATGSTADPASAPASPSTLRGRALP
ncbi:MAG: hypothetical protein ABSD62_02485 [Candidatus Limnocylindrales bacterium]|jgi:hypothetical protein